MRNKSEVLGMPISKASHRLNRDLIYSMGVKLGLMDCYRCGCPISREEFTVEHKIAWMDSDNPQATFFDLENVAFSHQRCNAGVTSHPSRLTDSERRENKKRQEERYRADGRYKDYNKKYNRNWKRLARTDQAFKDRERTQQREQYQRKKNSAC